MKLLLEHNDVEGQEFHRPPTPRSGGNRTMPGDIRASNVAERERETTKLRIGPLLVQTWHHLDDDDIPHEYSVSIAEFHSGSNAAGLMFILIPPDMLSAQPRVQHCRTSLMSGCSGISQGHCCELSVHSVQGMGG